MADTFRILGSLSDSSSFLQPALGFESTDLALAEAQRRQKGASSFGPRPFEVLSSQKYNYLPHNDGGEWDVQSLLSGNVQFPRTGVIFKKLATVQEPRPEGSYNVALLVEGRRSYSVWPRRTNKHPGWWYRLASGRFDCCAVWGRADKLKLSGGMVVGDDVHINAARGGRGAIYYSRANFDNNGQPDGFTSGVILIEFSILDRNPAKDNLLRVQLVGASKAYSYGNQPPSKLSVSHLGGNWQELTDRAREKFERTCCPVPGDIESWRLQFLEQREKYRAQRQAGLHCATFFDGIKNMPWDQALSLVQEAWQLKAVVDTHCGTQFDESVHRCDTNSSRVGRMLGQYNCSDERRAELRAMVSDFVAPMDELWSYSGD